MEGIHETDAPSPVETADDCGKPSIDGLAETGRRVTEQRMYRALVDHAYAMAARPDGAGWVGRGGPATARVVADTQGEIRIRGTARARPAGRRRRIARQGRTEAGRRQQRRDRPRLRAASARSGENVIAPAILRVAAEDPTRSLAGFDRRIKGEDRLKEKIADRMRVEGPVGQRKRWPRSADVGAVHLYVPRDRLYRGSAQGSGTA